jgi:hypothetical protein
MRYDRWWSAKASCDDFGERISRAWLHEYVAKALADPADLVEVDPGNGFRYTFDLAGTMRGDTAGREPRVVGVWGYSANGSVRDTSRMRGHPRPSVRSDDRGHLVACAAGGGYDINLVAMDAALNRGLSVAGARFRRLERLASTTAGSLYFVRLRYADDTAPKRLRGGRAG